MYAGKEPLSFTNRFPAWEISQEAEQANTIENRPSTLEDMDECFQRLSRSVYSFEELQQRPLPDGVNPNKLETYLSNEEFHVSMQQCAVSSCVLLETCINICRIMLLVVVCS